MGGTRISQFMSVTGVTDENRARNFLAIFNYELKEAVAYYNDVESKLRARRSHQSGRSEVESDSKPKPKPKAGASSKPSLVLDSSTDDDTSDDAGDDDEGIKIPEHKPPKAPTGSSDSSASYSDTS